eukprot:Rmarinus@m.20046
MADVSTTSQIAPPSGPPGHPAHPAHVHQEHPGVADATMGGPHPAQAVGGKPVDHDPQIAQQIPHPGVGEGAPSQDGPALPPGAHPVLNMTHQPSMLRSYPQNLPPEYVQRYGDNPLSCCKKDCLRKLWDENSDRFIYFWYKAVQARKNNTRRNRVNEEKRALCNQFHTECKDACLKAETKLLLISRNLLYKKAKTRDGVCLAESQQRRKYAKNLPDYDELIKLECCKRRCLSRLSFPQFQQCRDRYMNGSNQQKEEVLRFLLWNAYECDVHPWCNRSLHQFLGASETFVCEMRQHLREKQDGTVPRDRKRQRMDGPLGMPGSPGSMGVAPGFVHKGSRSPTSFGRLQGFPRGSPQLFNGPGGSAHAPTAPPAGLPNVGLQNGLQAPLPSIAHLAALGHHLASLPPFPTGAAPPFIPQTQIRNFPTSQGAEDDGQGGQQPEDHGAQPTHGEDAGQQPEDDGQRDGAHAHGHHPASQHAAYDDAQQGHPSYDGQQAHRGDRDGRPQAQQPYYSHQPQQYQLQHQQNDGWQTQPQEHPHHPHAASASQDQYQDDPAGTEGHGQDDRSEYGAPTAPPVGHQADGDSGASDPLARQPMPGNLLTAANIMTGTSHPQHPHHPAFNLASLAHHSALASALAQPQTDPDGHESTDTDGRNDDTDHEDSMSDESK